MENHFDKRLDPRLLVDDAKTVISLLFNYSTNESPYEDSSFLRYQSMLTAQITIL